MNRYWFKAKRIGWGWYPATWQGWFVMGLWALINVWWFLHVDSTSHSVSDTLINASLIFIPSTLLLLAVSYWKGETPRWRWGK